MSYIAIIPARGGSKGIKNKNLQQVGDHSLVARAILTARNVPCIQRVIVSTDSEDIIKESIKYGAEIHKRQAVTASDTAKTIDVIKEVSLALGLYEHVCVLLQPTSPLREVYHIQECIEVFEKSNSTGSVVTATSCEHHPYKMVVQVADNEFVPIRQLEDLESPRQALPKALRINGAVYVVPFKTLFQKESFFCQPQHFVEMEETESIDIDSYADLARANLIIKEKNYETKF